MCPTPLNSTQEAPSLPIEQLPPSTVADYGDVRSEFVALVSGCGLYELDGRVKIRLTGSDQVRWLNGMVTNNVRDLAKGHGVYAFLLNPQGRILGDLYSYNQGGSLLLDTDRSQLEKLLAIFDKYIIMDDVEVANISNELTAIGIAGPAASAVLKATGMELPNLEALQLAEIVWKDIKVTLVRSDNPSVDSFEIWLAPENLDSVRDAVVQAGAKLAGATALELLRVAAGIPRYGQDIRERDLPPETGQDRALHFSKGCYVGQEIVERIRSRGAVHRQFSGFEIQGSANSVPTLGTKLQADGKDVGEITSVASLPLVSGDRAVALGYIRREVGMVGKQVSTPDNNLTVVKLPFIENKR